MCRLKTALLISFFLGISFSVSAQQTAGAFRLVPLGVKGGIDESNLSAYMLAPRGSDHCICLDAGTLHYGIEKAVANSVFSVPVEQVLREDSKGCLGSHSRREY